MVSDLLVLEVLIVDVFVVVFVEIAFIAVEASGREGTTKGGLSFGRWAPKRVRKRDRKELFSLVTSPPLFTSLLPAWLVFAGCGCG